MIKTPSLIAAYNFNGNANDESGNGYDCIGTTTLVNSQFGQCANFNGSQYLSTQNNINLSNTNKTTICFWIKTLGGATPNVIAESSSYPGVNNAFTVGIGLYVPGTITFVSNYNASGDANTVYAKKSLNDGNWHYVTITCDRSLSSNPISSIYYDLVKQEIVQGRNVISNINYADNKLYLGSRNNSQYFFNGQLTRFKIYKKILSFEDIKRIYEGFSPLNG